MYRQEVKEIYKMTLKEAFEKQGLRVINQHPLIDEWWEIENGNALYVVRLVNGQVDYKARFTVRKYNRLGERGKTLCTRANFNKVVSLIKS